MSTQPNAMARSRAVLTLEYPMSLGRYDTYDEAQKAVDYLSDHEFPVQNVLIVGTDLKQLERVTGRLTRAGSSLGGPGVRRLARSLRRADLRAVRHRQRSSSSAWCSRSPSVPSSASSGR